MGVDTELYISKRWKVSDIREVAERRLGYKTKLRFHDFAPDYVKIDLYKGAELHRSLNVHTDSTIGGLPAVNINLRSNEEGYAILKGLAEVFGGLFQEADCDSDFIEIQPPEGEDGEFLLKECLKTDPACGRDSKLLGDMLINETWAKKYEE